MNTIQASNITKSFGSFIALDNVSISIPDGSIFGLLGPNGAGKTTFIRILTGITGPDSGNLNLNSAGESIGYLPEERGLYKKMKVWEQALYLTQLKGLSKQKAAHALKPWFKALKMTEWVHKEVDTLSKGMQQKLQFAITVAPNPKLLILDEPFSGFDPVNAEEIKREILKLNKAGTTIILSTHNMNSVEELCSHVALINHGKVIINDSLEDIKSTYKSSLYRISFIGSQVAFANLLGHQFEVISFEEKGSKVEALIKAFEGASPMQLLKVLANNLEIVRFEEKVPSMNDLFIDLVSPKTDAVE
ncbi:MAG: ABC transporter ATP-binding protein [Salibacteraceae bacterium]